MSIILWQQRQRFRPQNYRTGKCAFHTIYAQTETNLYAPCIHIFVCIALTAHSSHTHSYTLPVRVSGKDKIIIRTA